MKPSTVVKVYEVKRMSGGNGGVLCIYGDGTVHTFGSVKKDYSAYYPGVQTEEITDPDGRFRATVWADEVIEILNGRREQQLIYSLKPVCTCGDIKNVWNFGHKVGCPERKERKRYSYM